MLRTHPFTPALFNSNKNVTKLDNCPKKQSLNRLLTLTINQLLLT